MRNISDRMKEHADPKTDSVVAKHIAQNPGHVFNTDSPKILSFEHKTHKRRTKEAFYIQKINPELNIQEKSYNICNSGIVECSQTTKSMRTLILKYFRTDHHKQDFHS